jgi:hypothetical protein
MKKIAPIALIALFGALTLTSCKKDYTCECSVNGTVYGTTTFHTTKSKAKDACNATVTVVGAGTETCTLK